MSHDDAPIDRFPRYSLFPQCVRHWAAAKPDAEAIVAGERRPVPPGQVGEVCFRGPTVFEVRPQLPLLPNGKVDKKPLRRGLGLPERSGGRSAG